MTRVLFLLLFAGGAFAQSADLVVNGSFPTGIVRRSTYSLSIHVSNFGPDAAANTEVIVGMPEGARLLDVRTDTGGWNCFERGSDAVCSIASFPQGGGSFTFNISTAFVVPQRFDAPLTVRTSTTDVQPSNNQSYARDIIIPRRFQVLNGADSGDGSLRKAIEAANRSCDGVLPCEVLFLVPPPAVIEPLTALPPFTGCGTIFDAGWSSANRWARRAVEIDGRRLQSGNGLEIRPVCRSQVHQMQTVIVQGIAVNDFPGNGIVVAPAPGGYEGVQLAGTFLGTDATGNFAKPNGMRGLRVDAPYAVVGVFSAIMSGNARSGIFVEQMDSLYLQDTKVGLGADDRPLPNGASGIYIGAGRLDLNIGSVVAHNRDFGIALQPQALMTVNAAPIHSNGVQAIDFGLDGPGASGNAPPAPAITEAYYDAAADQTVIRGTKSMRPGDEISRVVFFANTRVNAFGHAEAETYLTTGNYAVTASTFEARVPGDLRGRIITAANQLTDWTHPFWETSELSDGVEVR